MDNIGDWIYVIFIAIAAISSIFGSSKKKQQQQSRQRPQVPQRPYQMPQSPKQTTQRPIFQQTSQSPKTLTQSVQERLKDIINTMQQTPQSQIHKTVPVQHHIKEGVSSLTEKEKKFIIPVKEEQVTAYSAENLPTNQEEWRKAFIYNEIFQRKY